MPVNCDEATLKSADTIIAMALDEDLRDRGDLTSLATVPEDATASVNIVAREAGFLSGVVLVERVYAALASREETANQAVEVEVHVEDGSPIEPDTVVATVTGSVRDLLTGERTALNFLIHLSGIASQTAEFVKRTEGSNAVILDTRKTLPGYRLLHKYAVRCGGGTNHRMGLFNGMLIKDNHLASRGTAVADAVSDARTFLNERNLSIPIEVEVDTLDQLKDALQQTPDIVLLDNMKPPELQQAIKIRDNLSPDTLLEASGGVTLESVGCIAGTGVDRISIGGLTHSAPSLDLGFDWA